MLIALTREPSPDMGRCQLTHLPRVAIDANLALAQHRQYRQALADLGCEVVPLPAAPDLPDAVFIEDTAVVVDEVAVVTRPGAVSRRPETASVVAPLRVHRQLLFIEAPGTLDGGDVLRVGRTLYVGHSGRSNEAGISQLCALLAPFGYQVKAVEVGGCLHLKSAVTPVAPATLLVNPQWVDEARFGGVSFIEVDPGESFAGNALLIGSTAVYPASFPRTRERLEARGIPLRVVEMSELQKAEGAVTCCSLVFRKGPAA